MQGPFGTTVTPQVWLDTMCSKITCSNCNKPTWEGCGEHIEFALGDVAPADRCACPRG
ncbi:hypothetical protein GCM10028820_25820 [Tessaracoccus terricola]